MWSKLDYRLKLDANGRMTLPELPNFRDATNAMRIVLGELRNEYDDVPS